MTDEDFASSILMAFTEFEIISSGALRLIHEWVFSYASMMGFGLIFGVACETHKRTRPSMPGI